MIRASRDRERRQLNLINSIPDMRDSNASRAAELGDERAGRDGRIRDISPRVQRGCDGEIGNRKAHLRKSDTRSTDNGAEREELNVVVVELDDLRGRTHKISLT